jgi:hypothetical protein
MRIALPAVTVLALLAPRAHADLLELRGEIHAGGSLGTGVGGAQKDSAFFAKAPNFDYGALVGAKIIFADAFISHDQFTDGGHIMTWTQFAAGVRFDGKTGGQASANGVPEKPPTGYWEFGAHVVFGLGTGAQVMPPLDNAQITDKGFTFELRPGFGKLLGGGFKIGLAFPISGGYFFKSGNGATANDLSTHYQGIEGAALLTFGMEIGTW